MNKIYLDHAATTPVDPEVVKTMAETLTTTFGNPGSLHSFGQEAKDVYVQAKQTIAGFIGCDINELIITSGGSESDNLAIRGLITSIMSSSGLTRGSSNREDSRLRPKGSPYWGGNDKQENGNNSAKPHIITSGFEHKAVLNTVESLEKAGEIEATYICPNKNGVMEVEAIKQAIKPNTVLVTIMYVNNEIGTIQPIREIGQLLKTINAERSARNPEPGTLSPRIYFHTDAVQAAGYCNLDPNYLGVDLMSISAHKIYGPKGIGALYIRLGTPIQAQITGGSQERGLRAGTENVAGIIGFAKAVSQLKTQNSKLKTEEISILRDRLIDGILAKIPDSILNGTKENLAPHIANISFINAEGEAILLNLDFLDIAVSTGSACTSRSLEPSHVLTSMGVPPEKAHGSIRFSLGRETTEAEIDRVLEVLPGIISKLRQMSPFK